MATAFRSTSRLATRSSTPSTAEPRSSTAERTFSFSRLATCSPWSFASSSSPKARPGNRAGLRGSSGPKERSNVFRMPSATPSPAAASAHERSGVFFAVAAFAMWGAFPAYFLLLRPAGAFEIVDWRVLFSLAFCLIVITITRRWSALGAIVRQPRQLFMLALAAVLIFINWEVYVWAVLAGHVVETALGYFINPIVTVLLGVVLLRERLRMAQWVAVGVSAIAVLVLAIGYGAFPWVALSLAFSFGLYGLVKKRVGPQVDALSGLTMETSWLVPLAIVQLVFGAFVLHEAMPTERWVGFGLVWIALIVLSIDLIVTGRTRRASALPA